MPIGWGAFRLARCIGSALAGLAALAVAGCQDVETGSVALISAPGVPISVESLEGGSDTLRSRFSAALSDEAASRRIELVGQGAAPRFRLRGYLDAAVDSEGKTAFSYVFDLYDASKRRARRVEGMALARGSSADAWANLDEAVLRKAAAAGMNEVAAFLAGEGPQVARQPAVPADEPVAFAPH